MPRTTTNVLIARVQAPVGTGRIKLVALSVRRNAYGIQVKVIRGGYVPSAVEEE
jgi:hypothetical protein